MEADLFSVIQLKNKIMSLPQSAVNIGWKSSKSLLDSTRKTCVSISSYTAKHNDITVLL
jgi:hypothetical protein